MGILETMIDIPADHEKNVFGQFDIFAKKIERALHVTLIARDGKVKVLGEEKNVEAEQYWGGMNPPPGPGMPPPPPPGPGMPPPPPPGGRDDMRSLIGVLLNNEMYRRRCRHRRCRRWW